MKRSGWTLVLAGLVGALYFWLTDPRFGIVRRWGTTDNAIDAANEASMGTLVGVAGSVIVLLIGLWLSWRKSA